MQGFSLNGWKQRISMECGFRDGAAGGMHKIPRSAPFQLTSPDRTAVAEFTRWIRTHSYKTRQFDGGPRLEPKRSGTRGHRILQVCKTTYLQHIITEKAILSIRKSISR